MSDSFEVYTLTELRVCGVKNDPEMVVLAITSGTEVRHYTLGVMDLKELAKQLTSDAMILTNIYPNRYQNGGN